MWRTRRGKFFIAITGGVLALGMAGYLSGAQNLLASGVCALSSAACDGGKARVASSAAGQGVCLYDGKAAAAKSDADCPYLHRKDGTTTTVLASAQAGRPSDGRGASTSGKVCAEANAAACPQKAAKSTVSAGDGKGCLSKVEAKTKTRAQKTGVVLAQLQNETPR